MLFYSYDFILFLKLLKYDNVIYNFESTLVDPPVTHWYIIHRQSTWGMESMFDIR